MAVNTDTSSIAGRRLNVPRWLLSYPVLVNTYLSSPAVRRSDQVDIDISHDRRLEWVDNRILLALLALLALFYIHSRPERSAHINTRQDSAHVLLCGEGPLLTVRDIPHSSSADD